MTTKIKMQDIKEFTIAGETYKLHGENLDLTAEAVDLVNKRMEEIKKIYKTKLTLIDLSVLTALNLAVDLINNKNKLAVNDSVVEEEIEKINKYLKENIE